MPQVVVALYASGGRRVSKLDELRLRHSWGSSMPYVIVDGTAPALSRVLAAASAPRSTNGSRPIANAEWVLLVDISQFVVRGNVLARAALFDGASAEVCFANFDAGDESDRGDVLGGGVLLSAALLRRLGQGSLGNAVPLLEAVRVLSPRALIADSGFVTKSWRRASTLSPTTQMEVHSVPEGGVASSTQPPEALATFPLDADVSDLKPEFSFSEGNAIVGITTWLLRTVPSTHCTATVIERT